MTIQLDGRQIFIASPSGVEDERSAVREMLQSRSRISALTHGIVLLDRGWEESASGVGRPQNLINELVDPCDFMIVILHDRWGSPTGHSTATSGTEEEFMRAATLLNDTAANMRDIHVFFQNVDADRLRDPGDDLKKVLLFKKKLEASKQVLFSTFDSVESLRARLELHLRKWSEPLEPKRPIKIVLPELDEDPSRVDDPLVAARAAAGAGFFVQADMLYAQAADSDNPAGLVEYARFARRRGLLDMATELNEQVVRTLASRDLRSATENSQLVRALASIGLLAREKGDLRRSLESLSEAVRVAESSQHPLYSDSAYAKDNLGHSFSHVGRFEEADSLFRSAGEDRRSAGIQSAEVPTELNLGWLALKRRDPQTGLHHFQAAEAGARESSVNVDLARCLAGQGDALVHLGRADEALPRLLEALEINRTEGNSKGVAIVSGLLARSYAALDDIQSAERAIEDTLGESEHSGNLVGLATAYWGRAQVNAKRGDHAAASRDFDLASRTARQTLNTALAAAIQRSREGDGA